MNVEVLSSTIKNLFRNKFTFAFRKTNMNKELDNIYTYAIVRNDMPKVHQAVQMAHAVQEAGKRFGPTNKVNYLICLQVDNKQQLFEAMEMLRKNDIELEAFYEPDYDRGLTAIATQYITTRKQRELFKNYKMLWHEEN